MDKRRAMHLRINATERELEIVPTIWDDPEPFPLPFVKPLTPREDRNVSSVPDYPYPKPLRPRDSVCASGAVCRYGGWGYVTTAPRQPLPPGPESGGRALF